MADDLGNNKFDVVVGGITRTPARILFADFLPAYAPFGKVALVNIKKLHFVGVFAARCSHEKDS